MLDVPLRRAADAPLNMVAAAIAPLIPANMLTLLGFVIALFCFSALAAGAWLTALPLALLNRLIDALDGPVARHRSEGPTALGGYLDMLADLVFYGGFVFFFAVGFPDHALAAAFLIFCFLVCSASFIASTLIPAPLAENIPGSPARRNRIFNPQLIENSETTIFFILMCLIPSAFTLLAGFLGLLTLMTAAINVAATYDRHINKRPHKTATPAQGAGLLDDPKPSPHRAENS